MASGVSGYAAISTRVRAMYSDLLSPQDMVRLSDAPDFPALVGLLKTTPYGKYLTGLKDNELTPRRAVLQIKHRLADSYSSVVQQAPEQTRPLIRQLYRYFELGNLKAVLRSIQTVSSWNSDVPAWDRVKEVLFPFGTSSIPAQAMVDTGNIASAIDLLRGTPYESTISFAARRVSTEQSLFPLEVALDLDYWRRLWAEARKLSGKDREMAVKIIGSLLDMNNLNWVIRYKIYHKLSEEELINYTLPFGFRVHDNDVRAIAAGSDIASVISRIYPSLANEVTAWLEKPQAGLPKLEHALKQQVMKQCIAAFIGDPFHIGIPIAYLLLSDFEVQDLIVLIEGKSFNMADEEYRPLLLKTTLVQ